MILVIDTIMNHGLWPVEGVEDSNLPTMPMILTTWN